MIVKALSSHVQALNIEIRALFLAGRDPRTPWYARALALLIAAYVLSPLDLIPDFIPLVGHLDDLVIVPAGLALAIRLVPPGVMAEARQQARRAQATGRGLQFAGGALVAILWILAIIGLVSIILHFAEEA